jgi:hypothetical protein
MKSDLWKTFAIIAITALLSISVTVVAIGLDKPDTSEVKDMIEDLSPYRQERSGLIERLNAIDQRLVRIENKIDLGLKEGR